MTNNETKPYSVNLWGSHPNAGNDDCNTGENFATLVDAREAFADITAMLRRWDTEHPQSPKAELYYVGWAFAELDGPDAHEIKPNPDQRAVRAHKRANAESAREWQNERAMQAGMAFGCDGYNDEMGY